MHNWIMAVLAAGALVVAAFPTYWSYKCRYEGTLCENPTFTAPSTETLARNQKLLQKSIADSGPSATGEFRLVPRETFWSGMRLDLVFSPPDKEDIVTDSLEIGDVELLETFRFPNSHIFGATYSKRENTSGLWRLSSDIVTFFEADGLTKRVFSIGCVGEKRGFLDPLVETRNLAYDVKTSVLSFALISNCSRPEINDKFTVTLDLPYPNSDEAVSVISRGETVFIRLDDQLQAVAVETSREREKKDKDKLDGEKTKLELASCRDREMSRWQSDLKPGAELLVACLATESSTFGSWVSSFQIMRITNMASKLLIEDDCGGWAGVISEKGVQPPYVAVDCSSSSGMYRSLIETASTEKDAKPVEKKPEWRAEWVQIFFGSDAKNYSMRVRCDCERLSIDRLSFDPVNRSAIFELETDATAVEVEGRTFPISKEGGDSQPKAAIGLYKVEFDRVGRVAGFEPAAVER